MNKPKFVEVIHSKCGHKTKVSRNTYTSRIKWGGISELCGDCNRKKLGKTSY